MGASEVDLQGILEGKPPELETNAEWFCLHKFVNGLKLGTKEHKVSTRNSSGDKMPERDIAVF